MRRMLVDESLSGITEEELRDDEKPDVLFTVEGLLEDVASVAVRRKFYDATTVEPMRIKSVRQPCLTVSDYVPHA